MTTQPLPPSLILQVARSEDLSPEMHERIDRLDQLAFNADGPDGDNEAFDDLEWSSSDVMILGWLGSELVSQVGILERDILVGGVPLRVGGVGGVATHPDHQGKGYAGRLMRKARAYLRDVMHVPFGLLVCGPERIAMYDHLGWIYAAGEWRVEYHGKGTLVQDNVMYLPLSDQPWPPGEIDIRGKPW